METGDLLIRIEADLYSGRDNPVWYVTKELVDGLFARLCVTRSPAIEIPSLGYRGVLAYLPEADRGTIRCYSGFVTGDAKAWCDKDRAMEVTLLKSGALLIDPMLLRELL